MKCAKRIEYPFCGLKHLFQRMHFHPLSVNMLRQEDFFKTKVDLEDMVGVQTKFEEAGHTDVPVAVVQKDGLKVVGDANKTEIKSRDYSVRFRFPKRMASQYNIDPDSVIKEIDDYVIVRFDFIDVHIVPRRDYEILESIIAIIPFFKKLDDDGVHLSDLSPEELLPILHQANDEIGDAMYQVVAAFLDIDPRIMRYMILTDVMARVQDFEADFPEVFKESDIFFG